MSFVCCGVYDKLLESKYEIQQGYCLHSTQPFIVVAEYHEMNELNKRTI